MKDWRVYLLVSVINFVVNNIDEKKLDKELGKEKNPDVTRRRHDV